MATKKKIEVGMETPLSTASDALAQELAIMTGTQTRRKQSVAPLEEKKARQASGHTQGRKGCKLNRIALGLPDPEYQFVKTISSASHMNMSQFITACIREVMNQHKDLEEHAQELLNIAPKLFKNKNV